MVIYIELYDLVLKCASGNSTIQREGSTSYEGNILSLSMSPQGCYDWATGLPSGQSCLCFTPKQLKSLLWNVTALNKLFLKKET